MNTIKLLLVACAATFLISCKLAVVVSSGGDVQSLSGTRNCSGGNICEFDIFSDNFNETFTAIPRQGYVFSKWQGGDGFQCKNSVNPACTVTNTGIVGIQGLLDIIARGDLYYAMPIYTFVGIDTDGDGAKDHLDNNDDNDSWLDSDDPCPLDPNPDCISAAPITDTVTVDGREWAQVTLFSGLSWVEIWGVCPQGECADNGLLNGYDMTGWTWASFGQTTVLFNNFLVAKLPTIGRFSTTDSPATELNESFFALFNLTRDSSSVRNVYGWVRDYATTTTPPWGIICDFTIIDDSLSTRATPSCTRNISNSDQPAPDNGGAWFYRTP